MPGRGGQAKAGEQGGVEVFALHEGVAAGVGFGQAGPHDDEGSAHAAFEQRGFASAQRGVAGGRRAVDLVVHVSAVVGGENNDGFLSEVQAVEGVEKRANGVVHTLDHRGVGGAALRVGGVDAGAVFFDQGFFGVERRMDAEHPVVQEKRAILIVLDEGGGFLGHAVFDVLVGLTGIGVEVFEFPRGDKAAGGTGAGPVREVDVEAVLKR